MKGSYTPAVAAPNTSTDELLLGVISTQLCYFPILTAAAASTHFLPSLFDAPSVEHAFVSYDGDVKKRKKNSFFM